MNRYIITNEMQNIITPLPPQKLKGGRPGKNDRLFPEAVSRILRTGSAWRDLPPDYGDWNTVYRRYSDWVKAGYFEAIFEVLKKESENEQHMIDGSITRAHQHGAGAVGGQDLQDPGRSCGGFSSKIHAKADSFGLPLDIIITAGNESDINYAQELIKDSKCRYLLADKGYDSDKFGENLDKQNIIPVIPGRKNRLEPIVYDEYIYKERNPVERFFLRIKNYRKLSTGYDKTSKMYR